LKVCGHGEDVRIVKSRIANETENYTEMTGSTRIESANS
jgi:hypothetical protein